MTAAIRSVQDAMAEIAEPLDTVGELLRTEGPRFLGALVVFVGVGLLGVVVAATVSRILDRTGWGTVSLAAVSDSAFENRLMTSPPRSPP